jgi:ubiquinone biosynthesis protein
MFNTLWQSERSKTIISILVKNGFDHIVNTMGIEKYIKFSVPEKSQETVRLSRHERIRKSVEELGPTFIKMAQILSCRPDLIPSDLVNEFSKLQDSVEPMPFEQIRPRFMEEFGKDVDEIFDGELILIASASLGQVYKGRLKSGEEVAVKVLKPGVEEIIHSDCIIMYSLASTFEEKLHNYGLDSPKKILQEFEKTIKKELDYNIEALNLKRFAKNFEDDERIVVPKLYEEFSGTTVLTMEFIDGIKISRIDMLEEAGIDPKEVAKTGFDLICEQIFEYRFFQADPHPGNIFALPDGRISFVDFGMMGSISERDRKEFVDMIYYIQKEEEEKAALCILKLAKVENDDLDRDEFAKDMGNVIRTYFYSSLKNIKIKNLLDDISDLICQHKVYFKESNYLLMKALFTIEGVVTTLDPDFCVTEEIKPFIIRFYKKNFSLSALFSRASELPKEMNDFLMQFPGDIKAVAEKMKSGKLKIEFQHMGLEEMEESIEKSANRLSISVIAATILVVSTLLLLTETPSPFFDFPVLGFIGFVTGIVMTVVLIYSIYKKGRL